MREVLLCFSDVANKSGARVPESCSALTTCLLNLTSSEPKQRLTSYWPRKASMRSVLDARLAGSAEAASASSSIAMAESASTPGSNGLTSNRKERSKRDAATAPSKPKPQPTAKPGAGTQDEQDNSGTLAAKRHPHRHFLFAQCHGECNHGIDPENTEQHCSDGKRGNQHGIEASRRLAPRDGVLHRLHLVERQLRVNLPNRCAQRIFHLLRSHTAAQNDPAVGGAQFSDRGENAFTGDRLCYRLVYLWHRLRIARPQLDVIDLAHHRHPRGGGLRQAPAQPLADRVLAWPVALGHLAIHDSHQL